MREQSPSLKLNVLLVKMYIWLGFCNLLSVHKRLCGKLYICQKMFIFAFVASKRQPCQGKECVGCQGILLHQFPIKG